MREVTELEGFFYLTFSDFKICKDRRKSEEASKIATQKQKESDELKAYLYDLIDSLDNGVDPEDLKLQLQDDWGRMMRMAMWLIQTNHKQLNILNKTDQAVTPLMTTLPQNNCSYPCVEV